MKVDGEVFAMAKRLQELGMKSKDIQAFMKLSRSTVNRIMNSDDYEDYREYILKHCSHPIELKQKTGKEIDMDSMYETFGVKNPPLVIDTHDERLICDAKTALVNNIWKIQGALYAIGKSLEMILKTNEEGKHNEQGY